MSEKDTAAEVEKLANNVIDQAIFICNLCDQFKHAETYSHHMKLAEDIAYHLKQRFNIWRDGALVVNDVFIKQFWFHYADSVICSMDI